MNIDPTDDDAAESPTIANTRIVDSAIADNVEEEKCVVAIYRTTIEQKERFKQHLTTCQRNYIPIEWVIDIADESNGWFYGTAYHFDDTTQMLHVMVPDKENPRYFPWKLYYFQKLKITLEFLNKNYTYYISLSISFDGSVFLDYRTVHLVECVDGITEALFNKIVRNSVVKVRWELEWFEEGSGISAGFENFML